KIADASNVETDCTFTQATGTASQPVTLAAGVPNAGYYTVIAYDQNTPAKTFTHATQIDIYMKINSISTGNKITATDPVSFTIVFNENINAAAKHTNITLNNIVLKHTVTATTYTLTSGVVAGANVPVTH